jgi:RNA exonuclease 1
MTENAEVVTNLDAHRTALDAALPPRTALVLFSGHSDPHSISPLVARRVGYQARYQENWSGSTAAARSEGSTVRWSTMDDCGLEEDVLRARMGLLFVGSRRNLVGNF